MRPSSARPDEKQNIVNKLVVANPNNYNYQNNNYKLVNPIPLNNNLNINNNPLIKKSDISPREVKQYKYESPYIKNANNNANINNNIKVPPQSLLQQKNNNIVANNNINMRPISSKDQKAVILVNNNVNAGGNVVNSIKKIVVPERKIGNQIKISENLIKNNYNNNYSNVKSGNPPQNQNNFIRPSSGYKPEPVKIANNAGNRYIIKK